MEDDSSDEPRKGGSEGSMAPHRARSKGVEITFWTSFEKREDVRAIREARDRTFKSLMNEATDLLIAKYKQQ